MHAWARSAAEAAACAKQQGEQYFWPIHDYFFEHQKDLSPYNLRQNITDYAVSLNGFSGQVFAACLDQRSGAAAVDRDVDLGKAVGVSGTPTIFVNGERITGYRVDQIRNAIDEAVNDKLPSTGSAHR